MIKEANEIHGEGLWALVAAVIAHLLAVLHERASEKGQKRDRIIGLCTLLHTEVHGLLESFKDKHFFIERHWADSFKNATAKFEATPVGTEAFEDVYRDVIVLSDETVKLFSLTLRRIKVMLNEYTTNGEFQSSEVRGMLALRIYNLSLLSG